MKALLRILVNRSDKSIIFAKDNRSVSAEVSQFDKTYIFGLLKTDRSLVRDAQFLLENLWVNIENQ